MRGRGGSNGQGDDFAENKKKFSAAGVVFFVGCWRKNEGEEVEDSKNEGIGAVNKKKESFFVPFYFFASSWILLRTKRKKSLKIK